jgi:hypothetical protein
MRGHQPGGQKPDLERQMAPVKHRAGGHRGLLAAAGALIGQEPARKLTALDVAASRTNRTIRPSRLRQPARAGAIIGKTTLELTQGTRKIAHLGISEHHGEFYILSTMIQRDKRRKAEVVGVV